ncbi:MAG TPA: DUF4331 family protein [Sporichthyaceae bacterium]|jgi:hypothetical protein|nr:DUF4331 family protein [Sporichthyaceae bacterium]
MSNHFSAANLKFPEDDARLDLTDLFVFPAPDDPDRTVLILDANPFMTGSEFHPDAVYRIHIDNDADVQADVAFSFVFSEPQGGRQTATAYYATGSQAREPEPTGAVLIAAAPVGLDANADPVETSRCRLFFGVRSDPFFADAEGFLHGFEWTGVDTFAGKNVLSIALEVPNDMLGAGPVIGLWATVSVRRDGKLVQVERDGHPSMNPIVIADEAKNDFNAGHPADDVQLYLEPLSKLLQEHGYETSAAYSAALTLLPDILGYDRSRPAGYPNGRVLTDDVFAARTAYLTNGKFSSSGVKPHADLRAEFPFLGVPNQETTS